MKGFLNRTEILNISIISRSLEIALCGGHGILYFGSSRTMDVLFNMLQERVLNLTKNQIIFVNPHSLLERHNLKFQVKTSSIIMAPVCLCGYLGEDEKICTCTKESLYYLWRSYKKNLCQSVDLILPIQNINIYSMALLNRYVLPNLCKNQNKLLILQRKRFESESFHYNGEIVKENLKTYCPINDQNRKIILKSKAKLNWSQKDVAKVLKISRTIADLKENDEILQDHLLEALYYRKFGRDNIYWMVL